MSTLRPTPPSNDERAGPTNGRRDSRQHDSPLAFLMLTALGVVYGDIGTSPIYAFRESFQDSYRLAPSSDNVLGVLSLIFWALIIVISLKYLLLVMRADLRGEGGIMVLTALVTPIRGNGGGRRGLLILLGLFGATLLYGDGMITPAISVLSAVEGLEVATPLLMPYVIPITLGILVLLFALQRQGSARIGSLFGPITLLWFLTLAMLGVWQLSQAPGVVAAVDPRRALSFFTEGGWRSFRVLGSVFLVVTGGEALYADMGHFGLQPIRLTWFALVLPALLLNYFGQGALLLRNPEALENPFFLMAPGWALYPLIAVATLATIIASQAVISGAFSLTRQAIQLGFLPRLEIRQTSAAKYGQIYVPMVNWVLMIACLLLVVGFGSSGNLAGAYGVGVTTTMFLTTLLFAVVAHARWRWHPLLIGTAIPVFLAVDLGFLGANLLKIPEGGWFPLIIAALLFMQMITWKDGRRLLAKRLRLGSLTPEQFISSIRQHPPVRVPGSAIFLHGSPENVPPALLANLRHNHVLHEQVVLLTVQTAETPRVLQAQRAEVEELGEGFLRLVLHFGFMEQPDVPRALGNMITPTFDLDKVTYFLGRESLLATERPGMALWREQLFSLMSRNALSATSFFSLPPSQVVELGMQVEL